MSGTEVNNGKVSSRPKMQRLIEILGDKYGPYAFGFITMLVMWFSIVRPELAASRLSFAAQQEVTSRLQRVSEQLQLASEGFNDAASRLERFAGRHQEDR